MYRIQVIEIICRLLTVPSELVNPPALVLNAIEREIKGPHNLLLATDMFKTSESPNLISESDDRWICLFYCLCK